MKNIILESKYVKEYPGSTFSSNFNIYINNLIQLTLVYTSSFSDFLSLELIDNKAQFYTYIL